MSLKGADKAERCCCWRAHQGSVCLMLKVRRECREEVNSDVHQPSNGFGGWWAGGDGTGNPCGMSTSAYRNWASNFLPARWSTVSEDACTWIDDPLVEWRLAGQECGAGEEGWSVEVGMTDTCAPISTRKVSPTRVSNGEQTGGWADRCAWSCH